MLACVGVLLSQLVLPGFIGLANNGDFPKIAGRLCIGGADEGADNFLHFQSDYRRAERFCWTSEIRSSEIVPASIASSIQKIVGNSQNFDIRWLGAVHGLVFLAAYYFVLMILRPLHGIAWLAAAMLALWIFADVSYVAYFNSFYTDSAAILGAMVAIPAAVLLSSGVPRGGPLLLFASGALLFITSKGQHGALGPLLAAFLIVTAWRARVPAIRVMAAAGALGLLAGVWWIVAATPDWYKGTARFNLIFYKILPRSPVSALDARQLGLTDDDLKNIGLHAYTQGSPAADPEWMRSFCSRSGYGQVLRFYLRHPARTLGILKGDLDLEAWQRRPENLSNYRRQAGYPPGAKTGRFGSWSAVRSWLFIHMPWHIVIWYALVLITVPILASILASRSPALAWTTLLVVLLAAGEFFVASLTDALETFRHLILFHLFTDFSMFLSVTGVLFWASQTGRPQLVDFGPREETNEPREAAR